MSFLDVSQSISPGTLANFASIYEGQQRNWDALVGKVAKIADSKRRLEVQAFYGAGADMEYREDDEAPRQYGVPSFGVQIRNRRFVVESPWSRYDVEDEQVGNAEARIQGAAKKAAMLWFRLISEYAANVVDPVLLPVLANAADGAAWFSATDGAGADRFFVSGGNIQTGDLTTTTGIIEAIRTAVAKFPAFKDPFGKAPVYSPDIFSQGYVLMHAQGFEAQVVAALKQQLIGVTGEGTQTNVIMDGGYAIERLPNPFLTGADMFLFAKGAEKGFCVQRRDGPKVMILNEANSPEAVRQARHSIVVEMRGNVAPVLPTDAIKITQA